jgi:serine/threonine protein kinase
MMKWMGKTVAVKFINAASGNHDLIATARSEADVMAALHHPCIVSLYGITVNAGGCGLVMEYCSGGTLSEFLKNAANAMDDAMKIRMACQITSGIAYLHAHSVVHRDIKSGNMMLDAEQHCKLIDFGLSRVRQHLTTLGVSSVKPGASIVGTLYWMAPEIIAHEDSTVAIPYNKATDIYALGITLWEIVARKTPYQACGGNAGLIVAWKVQGKHDAIPADASGYLIDAIEACRKSNPADRPSADAVLVELKRALNRSFE